MKQGRDVSESDFVSFNSYGRINAGDVISWHWDSSTVAYCRSQFTLRSAKRT